MSDEPKGVWINPDCRDGKHRSCSGEGWNWWKDEPALCPCPCHSQPKVTLPSTCVNIAREGSGR